MNKFTKKENQIEKCILDDIILEYKPGIITKSYLGQNNLLLKNISKLDTSVLERFNEFFSESQILTLNEDIHNTFSDKKNKKLKLSTIRTIATSYSGTENKISETISSRFTIIQMNPYNEDEENVVLNLYSKDNHININEKFLNVIEKFSKNYYKMFSEKLYLNQKKIILDIF